MKKEFDIIDLDFTDALPVVKEEDTKEKYYSTEETISEENYEAEENTAGANVNANAEELTINEEAAGAEVFQGEVSVDTIIMSGIADAVEGITKENSNGYNGAVIYDKESTDKIREEIELALESGELPAEEAAAFAPEEEYIEEEYIEEEYIPTDGEYIEEEYIEEEYIAADGEYVEGEYVEEAYVAADEEYYEEEYAETDEEYYEEEYAEADEALEEELYEEAYEEDDVLEFTDVEDLRERPVKEKRKKQKQEKKGFVALLAAKFKEFGVGDWVVAGTGVAVLVLAVITLVFWNGARETDNQVANMYDVGYELSNLGIAGESGLLAFADAMSSSMVEIPEEEPQEEAVLSEIEVTFTSVERDLKIKFINGANNRLVTDLLFEVVLTDEDGEELTLRDEDLDGIIYENDMEPGEYEVAITEMEGYAFASYDTTITVKDQIVYEEIDVSQEIRTEEEVNVAVEDTAVNNAEEEAELEETPVLTDTVEWVESTRTPVGGSDGYRQVNRDTIPEPDYASRNVIEVDNIVAAAGNYVEIHMEMQTLVRTQSGSTSDNTAEDEDTTGGNGGSASDNEPGNNNSGNNNPGDNEPEDDEPDEPTEVTATVSISGTQSISVNGTTTLTATAKAGGSTLSGGSFSWSSDRTSVATVNSSGKVTGVAAGTATITAEYSWNDTANNKEYSGRATITVTVTEENEITVSSVTVSPTTVSLSVNGVTTLAATATMSDGSKVTTASSFTWSSDKTNVATVDSSGKVTAKGVGTAVITVTYTDEDGNKKSATCTVTVANRTVSAVSLNKSTTTITRGSTETLSVTATMSDGSKITNASSFTWESNNTSVATVNSAGKITAVATGEATITVSYTDEDGNKKSATCTVTVVANPAEDTTSKLKDRDGNQVYIRNANGNYVEAVYADYYTASAFYIASDVEYTYTGWQTINGNVYFFDKNGNKVTGEQIIQGVRYNFTSEGILAMNNNGVLGIDVSKWNGTIDWNAVRNSGISYVIIRCGYRGSSTGVLVEDPMFRTNIQGATAAGLKVGVYFFTQAINEVEAVEEASMVLSLIRNYSISYPVFIDTERANGRADGLDAATRTAVCRAFCETIRNAGYSAGVYASKYWYYDNLNYSSLSGYNIWLAQYASEPTFNHRYDLWQYTENGTVNGVNGHVDMNISYLGY